MSLAQHKDDRLRFNQQVDNTEAYVVPFIEEQLPITSTMSILEIGCGEGGVLKPFLDRGCSCVGVDLVPQRIQLAETFLSSYLNSGQLRLIAKNIYELDFLGEFKDAFDLILLKDAIEHIPEQEKIIAYMRSLLKPKGCIFFGFPPWYMPHGGHQQICTNRVLSMFPYVHLLPARVYKGLLKLAGENPSTIQDLMEVKDTGISIERFERILNQTNYLILIKRFYLINPIYQYKFGWKPKIQLPLISKVPFIRNFLTTCVYYLVQKKG